MGYIILYPVTANLLSKVIIIFFIIMGKKKIFGYFLSIFSLEMKCMCTYWDSRSNISLFIKDMCIHSENMKHMKGNNFQILYMSFSFSVILWNVHLLCITDVLNPWQTKASFLLFLLFAAIAIILDVFPLL